MNPQRFARALNTLQMGLAELAEAFNDSPTPARAGGPGAAVPPAAAPVSTFSDGLPIEEPPLFPDAFDLEPRTSSEFRPPRPTAQDQVMAECPVHFKAWTIKEGGMSKNGKPYTAFWKCSGKNDDGSYCDKKPTKEWVKTHDPEKALSAA